MFSIEKSNFQLTFSIGKLNFSIEKMFFPEKYFLNFSDIFFHFEKKVLTKYFYLYRSKIFSGIQKSYLENRAGNLNRRKNEKTHFIVLNPHISTSRELSFRHPLCSSYNIGNSQKSTRNAFWFLRFRRE